MNLEDKLLFDCPPPTISGNLHIGHIFSYTIADIIHRYWKYKNKDTQYVFGIDNNGLPTIKLASKQGITTPNDILEFSLHKGESYRDSFSKAGIEFIGRSYNTMSKDMPQLAFNKLKELGYAYEAEEEYMYSEQMKTSISEFELDANGLIEKTGEKPIIKKEKGWFINIMDHKQEILDAINKINWYPQYSKDEIINWTNNLKWNWSISRERNYGVNIPETSLVFDTWFVSALSPALANNNLDYPTYYLRYQGHDIVRSWAFYTIALSMFLRKDIPWYNIIVTGHVLDGKGNKFSKSSGNATLPDTLIDKYKPYGIRHWVSKYQIGTDCKIDEQSMKMGWRIKNKYNNAIIFTNKQIEEGKVGENDTMWSEYLFFKSEIEKAFESFDLSKASDLIYKLLWNTICDDWIEQSKVKPVSITLMRILKDFENLFNVIYN